MRTIAAFLLILGIGCAATAAPRVPRGRAVQTTPKRTGDSAAVRAEIQASVRRGLSFLRTRQGRDGAWQQYPGITSVCTMAFLRHGITPSDTTVARAAGYLARLAKPSGALYTDQLGPAQALPNYNTALAMTALHLTRDTRYAPVVRKAGDYLAASQFDEGEGISPQDRRYGGIGYGSREDNPDVSNLQNALEALRETGRPRTDAVFRKALAFLQRCQNRAESNDQAWAGQDGGFVYASSGESKADEQTKKAHSSYGSMTYAGLKSYLYCDVQRTDLRVQAAWNWLRANYDVQKNPHMGDDGLYYYYHTMAKTLALWGEKHFTETSGAKHPWAAELARAIVRRQRADGAWTNQNPRWWEDRPELSTGYALLALAHCLQGLD